VRHQVRIMVGSLVEVGSGRQPVAWLGDALVARRRDAAGPTAPATGLTLEHVGF
jgi:tRNA pseudouridine38-40 synthase